ncbi:MAG: addiction module antidote protein [candidate division FCPU426 bacterium]
MKSLKPYKAGFQKDLVNYLKDPEAAAEYLNAALAGGDQKVLCIALRNVAQAHGNMTELAKSCKMSRNNLYHITSKKGNPSLGSILKIIRCLGMNLTFTIDKNKSAKIIHAA